MHERNDQRQRRCPRLGGPVTFLYCRTCGDEEMPCFKAIDCWWEYFDVVAYLKKNLNKENFNRLAGKKPKPKITSLIELIEQAKKRATAGDP